MTRKAFLVLIFIIISLCISINRCLYIQPCIYLTLTFSQTHSNWKCFFIGWLSIVVGDGCTCLYDFSAPSKFSSVKTIKTGTVAHCEKIHSKRSPKQPWQECVFMIERVQCPFNWFWLWMAQYIIIGIWDLPNVYTQWPWPFLKATATTFVFHIGSTNTKFLYIYKFINLFYILIMTAVKYNTALLSLCREICLLVCHLHKTCKHILQ